MTYERLVSALRGSLYETLVVGALLTIGFMAFEPAVSRAVTATDTDEFIVTQSITDEISFETLAADVVMSPAIAGLTGGQATGSTYVVISTNSPTGYTLDIRFSTATAMTRNGSNGGDVINNYSPAGTTSPTVNFEIGGPGTPGEFGYTVEASSTPTIASEFRGNGSTLCNIGESGTFTLDQCWQAPSITDREIINAPTNTPTGGATTTIKFVVTVPGNPNPTLPTGLYVATVTLTAVTQ